MTCLSTRNPWYDHGVKRILDFLLALSLLIILMPLMLVILLLLIILQPGAPIFRQVRVGYHCRPFYIYKFRTMTKASGADGELLPDAERTTWVGRLLRASSLDELPELINVLKGDMSLIGPRPWIPEQMAIFQERTRQARMSVRPGLSGLAQILGRNNLTFRQRVCLDIRYIRHQSFLLDVRIFFLTIYKILKREGIYQLPDALPSNAPKDPTTRGLHSNAPRKPNASPQ